MKAFASDADRGGVKKHAHGHVREDIVIRADTEPETDGLWYQIGAEDDVPSSPHVQVVNYEMSEMFTKTREKDGGTHDVRRYDTTSHLYNEHRLQQEKLWKLKRDAELKKREEIRAAPLIDQISADIATHLARYQKKPDVVERLYDESRTVNLRSRHQQQLQHSETVGERSPFSHRPSINDKSTKLQRGLNDLICWDQSRRAKMESQQKENQKLHESIAAEQMMTTSFMCDGSKKLLTKKNHPKRAKIEEHLLSHGERVKAKLSKQRQDDVVIVTQTSRPKINKNTERLLAQKYAKLSQQSLELGTAHSPSRVLMQSPIEPKRDERFDSPSQQGASMFNLSNRDCELLSKTMTNIMNSRCAVIQEEREEDENKVDTLPREAAEDGLMTSIHKVKGRKMMSPQVLRAISPNGQKPRTGYVANRADVTTVDSTQGERSPKRPNASYTEIFQRRKTAATLGR